MWFTYNIKLVHSEQKFQHDLDWYLFNNQSILAPDRPRQKLESDTYTKGKVLGASIEINRIDITLILLDVLLYKHNKTHCHKVCEENMS